jgi:subtilisin family serine protease
VKNKVAIAISTALMSVATLQASADMGAMYSTDTLKAAKAISINKNQGGAVYNKKKFVVEKDLGNSEYTYIVRLKDQPIATYNGGIQGLSATNPQVAKKSLFKKLAASKKSSAQIRKELRLDLSAPEAVAYANFLESKQQKFLAKASAKLGSGLNVVYKYKNTFNGMAVRLTQAEAAQLSTLADVAFIERERLEHIETDTGPTHIGATNVWMGTGQTATNMGEGVIIGVIDTGINSDHPAFADVGADGYDHTNPWGTGVYKGDCAGDFASMCNDKLIGVHSYAAITDNYSNTEVFGDTPPPANGEDYNGHGSHTASTAGGNILLNVPMVDAENGKEEGDGVNSTGFHFSQISGVAPHANIVAYQICSPGDSGDTYSGCPSAAILAALEDAVADGVDVINYSISGGGDPWASSSEQAFLAAQEAGIFAAVSAGNSGPNANTTEKSAPWYTVVGAATHGRTFVYTATVNDKDYNYTRGSGPSFADPITGPLAAAITVDADNFEGCTEFAADAFKDHIALISRGSCAFSDKVTNATAAGATAVVVYNNKDGDATLVMGSLEETTIPAVMVSQNAGAAILADLELTADLPITIDPTPAVEIGQADDTADFSSRGPNSFVADVMTPSVTAPGVSIYAAYSDQQFGHDVNGPAPADYAFLQGTSMSSPHVAGAGAVLKSSHPTWTPDNIRSALMLTATTDVRKEDGVTTADFFDMGAGRIRVDLADKTGLVMNETAANYTAANPATGGSPRDLNIPSVSDANCVGTCSWKRTVTATADGTWAVSGVSISDGLVIEVTPASFSLAAGESQELTITVDAMNAESDAWAFGHVVMTADGFPEAKLPVSVKASNGNVPEHMSFNSHRNIDSSMYKDVMAVEITDFTARSYGLTKATKTEAALAVDSDNSSAYDDIEDGIYVTTVTVPENAKRFVAEILASASPDLDLRVGIDANGDGLPQEDEEIATSATATALEQIDLMNPQAGSYWVAVQNWAASEEGAEDAFTLATAVVDGELNDNLAVTTESNAIPALTNFDLTIAWDLGDAVDGDVFYGAVDLGTSAETAGNLGLVAVDVDRGADDVSLSNDIDGRLFIGDKVHYQVSVLANFMPEDRTYTIQASIPAGMKLDADSVTGDATVTDNQITWVVERPSLLGASPSYDMVTNMEDESCVIPAALGGGSYVDLAGFGIGTGELDGDLQSVAYGVKANFMGTVYETINVTDDGFIYFTGTAGSAPYENQLLPDVTAANNLVAPFWRDNQIVRSDTAGVSVATAGSAWTIVEFDDVKHWLGYADNATSVGLSSPVGDIADFEVIFDNTTGNFYFAYDNVTHDWGSNLGATVGYEDMTGESGRADIYAKSVWGGADGAVSSVEAIESGLLMCYTLVPVPDAPLTLNFTTEVAKDYKGGNLAVTLSNSVDAVGTVDVVNEAAAPIEVEGAPVAMIDAPNAVTEETSVTIDGSVSTDPNGDELTYTWVQLGGTPVSFSANTATITFAAPKVTKENDVISFHLTVDDGNGNTDTEVVAVNVLNKKAKGGSFGWLVLLSAPLLWLRRRVKK